MIERNANWDVRSDDKEFDKMAIGPEDGEQIALMGWAARAIYHGKFPELVMLHAVPNGGERNVVIATKLKATGVKAGVPDLFLDVPRHGMHGLRIELKRHKNKGGGRPTSQQLDWAARYHALGYGWCLAWGWLEARDILVQYLDPAGTGWEWQRPEVNQVANEPAPFPGSFDVPPERESKPNVVKMKGLDGLRDFVGDHPSTTSSKTWKGYEPD